MAPPVPPGDPDRPEDRAQRPRTPPAHAGRRAGRRRLARAAKRHDLDGIVFIDAGAPDPALADLAASGLPCVALDRPVTGPRATYVTSDNVGGARAAVAHLHARGRRRIATIAGPRRTWPGADRLAGYRLELSALGLPYREELVAEGDFYLDSGHAAMRRLLAPDERPDAVFAAGDQMAIGALRALAEAGLRVPEDVALVGFDDIELAALVPPGLTTVAQDKTAFGTAAARALIAMLPPSPATPHPPAILPTRLVIRGTT
ncbi:substrate-binding domain-containing protein [Thermocatellispora tengchongensis]|uniref:substrate-binding domain-containing protein n=1 Tax=Thermocatellispora tengchongensis TaxID=1073253 RepID=UPI0036282760